MTRGMFIGTIYLTIVAIQAGAQTMNVVVWPKEIHSVLVNPGKDIQTFQRFNGQPLNPGFKWSETGPTPQLQGAPTPPGFPAGRD